MFTASYYKQGKYRTRDFEKLDIALQYLCDGMVKNVLHPLGIKHNDKYLIETTEILKLRNAYVDLKNYHYNKDWKNVIIGLLDEI